MVLPIHCSKLLVAAALVGFASTAAATPEEQAFLNFIADQQAAVEKQDGKETMSSVLAASESDKRVAADIADSTQAATLKNMGAGASQSKYRQFKTLMFITMGMPEKSLRALFRQGAGRGDIGFVLRGMQTPDLYREVKRVRDLMSEEGESIVFVDPLLFRHYKVDRAPFTLHKARDGRWYGLWGEISVDGARERIEQGLAGRNRPPVGPIYALKEPDMHNQMKKKFDTANWDQINEKARKRAERITIDVSLPAAPKDRIRLVDVSSKLLKDVIGPNGDVLAKAGTLINPLEYVTLDQRYVVFDPNSRYEREVVERWMKKYSNVTLITTHWDSSVQEKYQSQVYVLDPLLKRRLGIEYTPSLVEQEGTKVRVTELRARP